MPGSAAIGGPGSGARCLRRILIVSADRHAVAIIAERNGEDTGTFLSSRDWNFCAGPIV